MEDVLDVYQLPYNEKRPVVCLDETCRQLIGEITPPLPTQPGHAAVYDYEYVRNAVADLFMCFEPLAAKNLLAQFWTYVGKKKNKVWLIYAYHRETGEIVAYVWGKRDLKTAQKLRKRIKRLGITYDAVATDSWDSFLTAFSADNQLVGKRHTVGIEGNNCCLRHRVRRAFRRTCCFSKKIFNHWKAFTMAFFYINYGFL